MGKRLLFIITLFLFINPFVTAQDFHLKMEVPEGKIDGICITPNGKYLASYSNDNTIRLWEVETGILLREYNFQWPIRDASFSPDNKMLACVSDNKIHIFDIISWEKLYSHKQGWKLSAVSYSIDGSFIVYGDYYGNIGFIKEDGGKLNKLRTFVGGVGITEITFNETGNIMTVSLAGNWIKILRIQEHRAEELKMMEGKIIRALKNNTFISANKNIIEIWDLHQKGPMDTIFNPNGVVTDLVLTPKGFISSGINGSIIFWTNRGDQHIEYKVSGTSIIDMEVSYDFSILACAMNDGSIMIYKNPKNAYIGVKEIASDYVRNYVEEHINEWQKKGRYEKTIDFKNRVNEETRDIQIELYTQEAINNYVLEEVNWSEVVADYDADNESFKLTIDNIHTIIVPVPLSEARSFDDSFKELKFTNTRCAFTDDFKPAISYLEIYNPANEKVYIYDSKDLASFSVAKYSFNFEEIEVILPQTDIQDQQTAVNDISIGKSDVDLNIPSNKMVNDNIYALIIGNEDYSSYQTGLGSEVNVKFANNDAKVFKEYLVNTMGVPEDNIHLLLNATYGQSMQYLSKLEAITEILGEKAEIIFYYSGHGFPDEVTKEPYIMPVDASATNLISAIKLNQIYGKLTKHPTKRVTIFLDACFSGGARDQGLLAARSVKIKPQENQVTGNVVVFTASSGIEPALGYDDKQHGMFTYYLLKKLQESEGDLSYQELGEYIQDQVELQSVVINNKRQKPQINLGSGIDEDWGEWRFVEEL